MLPRAPLHSSDVLLRLRGLPLGVSSEQGFAMGEGGVWCEEASFSGSDMAGPVHSVGLEPSPDAIRPDLNVRRNVEQPVYQIHTHPHFTFVHGLFSSACVPQIADFCNSVPPREPISTDVNHAGIRVQVESDFALRLVWNPVFGGGHA